jgi:acyl-CoA hydrolase
METEVLIDAEDLRTGERRRVSTAFLVFVGIGDDGQPIHVPPLELQTDDERREFAEAAERRASRLANRPSS